MGRLINLQNQRFGKLTVIQSTNQRGEKGEMLWECACDCGGKRTARSTALRSGEVLSCGCNRAAAATRRLINLTGQKFGRLTVIARLSKTKFGQPTWTCICECGNQTTVNGQCLRTGQTKSCGCLKVDAAKRNIKIAKAARNLPPGRAHFNAIIQRYRDDAKRRGYCFSLTSDDFRAITQKECYYCGTVPVPFGGLSKMGNGCFVGNGIDRVDNSIGYTLDNCVPACRDCNYAKRTLSHDRFISLARRIAEKHRH